MDINDKPIMRYYYNVTLNSKLTEAMMTVTVEMDCYLYDPAYW